MTFPFKIYLCGGINKLSDADCRDWREAAKTRLFPAHCIDPMRRDYRGKEAMSVKAIVAGDMADIRACDVVLANATRPSWGTAMEIRIAYELGKFIVAFGAGEKPSPWLVHHCQMEETLELATDCIGYWWNQNQ